MSETIYANYLPSSFDLYASDLRSEWSASRRKLYLINTTLHEKGSKFPLDKPAHRKYDILFSKMHPLFKVFWIFKLKTYYFVPYYIIINAKKALFNFSGIDNHKQKLVLISKNHTSCSFIHCITYSICIFEIGNFSVLRLPVFPAMQVIF